jgi:putative transcriptional regulator
LNDEMFEQLLASVREGGAILRGEAEPSRSFNVKGLDIKRIRSQYKLSQRQFAALLGISAATLRNWEQGRRSPEGPARVLLQIAERHPEALVENISPQVQSRARRAASSSRRSTARTTKRKKA